jgi:hypothetical protein
MYDRASIINLTVGGEARDALDEAFSGQHLADSVGHYMPLLQHTQSDRAADDRLAKPRGRAILRQQRSVCLAQAPFPLACRRAAAGPTVEEPINHHRRHERLWRRPSPGGLITARPEALRLARWRR